MFQKFKPNQSQIFLSSHNKSKLGCIVNGYNIENISFDLNNYLYGIYYLSTSGIAAIKSIMNNYVTHNYFIFELINRLIDKNHTIAPLFID